MWGKSYEMNTALLNALFGETHSDMSEQEQDNPQKVLFSINKVDLYGIEFRLFVARRLYPSNDKISFVFLRAPYYPELDGRLVYVEDDEECKYYECDLIKNKHTCIIGNLHPMLINVFATILSPFSRGQVCSAQSPCKILSLCI